MRASIPADNQVLFSKFESHLIGGGFTRVRVAHHLERAEAFLAYLREAGISVEAVTPEILSRYLRAQLQRYVCPRDIRFEAPPCVRLFGKGRKERVCPLWPETLTLLKALLRRQPRAENERLFVSRYGQPLGASGLRYKLAGYVAIAAKAASSLLKKAVSPHAFRHAAAVSLVSSGTDVTVIRSWLGHASLDTTNLYAQANLAAKRAALERTEPLSSRRPRWKRDPGLIEWLDRL